MEEKVGAAGVDISNSGLILYETMNCDIDVAG